MVYINALWGRVHNLALTWRIRLTLVGVSIVPESRLSGKTPVFCICQVTIWPLQKVHISARLNQHAASLSFTVKDATAGFVDVGDSDHTDSESHG